MQESRQRPDVLDLLLHPFITTALQSPKALTTEFQVTLQCRVHGSSKGPSRIQLVILISW